MNTNIYLHEIIRTVPGREEPYLASVLSLHYEPARRGRGHPAFAQFRSAGTSGAWPCAINIWENTWAGQAADLSRQFQDAQRDTAMEDWWNRNLHLRRGGYDRLLIPASFSPTLADRYASIDNLINPVFFIETDTNRPVNLYIDSVCYSTE